MSKPSARITDKTAHGGTITTGAATVVVGGLPAARISDMHVCPLSTGPVPHVGGPVAIGSPTVIVAGMPAGRVADMAICIGPPDSIAMGEPTVLIGSTPATGIVGALSSIKSVAVAVTKSLLPPTYPRSVTLDDGSVAIEYTRSILIEGTSEFQGAVIDRLAKIESTQCGQTLLESIEASGKSMVILEYYGPNSAAGPEPCSLDTWAASTPKGRPVHSGRGVQLFDDCGAPMVGRGTGADTMVELNPAYELNNPLDPSRPFPNDAILFHEMLHSSHMMNGTYDGEPLPGWTIREEQTTILTGDPSEADYLRERGYPFHRISHHTDFAPNVDA